MGAPRRLGLRSAGIDRSKDVVTWNVVPWYLGSDTRLRAAGAADVLEARPYITELLTLLPALRVVVLVGKPAARGWAQLDLDIPTIKAPHPSPLNLSRGRSTARCSSSRSTKRGALPGPPLRSTEAEVSQESGDPGKWIL